LPSGRRLSVVPPCACRGTGLPGAYPSADFLIVVGQVQYARKAFQQLPVGAYLGQ
jgi:hypothetical protein